MIEGASAIINKHVTYIDNCLQPLALAILIIYSAMIVTGLTNQIVSFRFHEITNHSSLFRGNVALNEYHRAPCGYGQLNPS